MSLIKKASYLADKGQVTFGRDYKHFLLVRETRKRDNSWNTPNQGWLGFTSDIGTNCAVSGCLFNTLKWIYEG